MLILIPSKEKLYIFVWELNKILEEVMTDRFKEEFHHLEFASREVAKEWALNNVQGLMERMLEALENDEALFMENDEAFKLLFIEVINHIDLYHDIVDNPKGRFIICEFGDEERTCMAYLKPESDKLNKEFMSFNNPTKALEDWTNDIKEHLT